jgi:hypothetical protein
VQEVLYKQLAEEPVRIREVRPDTPEPLALLLERALRKDRDQRWATMDEALRALESLLPAGHLHRFDRMGQPR